MKLTSYLLAGVAAAGFGAAAITATLPSDVQVPAKSVNIQLAACTGTVDQITFCNWAGVFQPRTYLPPNGQNSFIYSNTFTNDWAKGNFPWNGTGSPTKGTGTIGDIVKRYLGG